MINNILKVNELKNVYNNNAKLIKIKISRTRIK